MDDCIDVNQNGTCDVDETLDDCQVDTDNDGTVDCEDSCPFGDFDNDGICDAEDPCVGVIDVLGICNGSCFFNVDADNICDDTDNCVDTAACNYNDPANGDCLYSDTCGVCGGPGEVYECGCADILEGDCDCEGNQLDVVGVCGGDCWVDLDDDGVCDDIDLCFDLDACNFGDESNEACDYCSCSVAPASGPYALTVESFPAVQEGLTTYRFYVNMEDATDRMSAVFGNNDWPMEISTPEGAFNSAFNSSWSASGINPAFVASFPELADDTYATIGLDGPAVTSGLANAEDPSLVQDAAQPITPFFQTDGTTSLLSNTLTGSSWYVLNTAGNGLPDADLRVCLLYTSDAADE